MIEEPRQQSGSNQPADQGANHQGSRQEEETPWQEWVAAAIGLALVTGTLGFLIWRALATPAAPPAVTAQVEGVHPGVHGYLVEFRVVNHGSATAAGLTVEGELWQGDRSVETSATMIDYVPARSERKGGLFFKRDPRQFRLELRPKGYQRP
jgi:uncharacterized protein (TIGR02588 family)